MAQQGRKPNTEAALVDAELCDGLAGGNIEHVDLFVDPQSTSGLVYCRIDALPVHFATPKVDQNDNHRKIATAPVLHVYWITKILEAAVRLGRVNPVFGRLDLSGDEAP